MRKVNVKLFRNLLIGTALLIGAVFLLHTFQSGRVRAALLWQAQRAEEQGQPERVAHYLSRYLEFAPEDLDERVHLGQTLASESLATTAKARARAVFVLESVLARAPDRNDMRLLLARLAMDLGRWELAHEHLLVLQKAGVAEEEVARLEGRYHEVHEQFAEAEASYARANAKAPQVLANYVRRAYLLRAKLKEAAKADQVMDQLVDANSQNFSAYLERWNYRAEFGLLDKPEQVKQAGEDVRKAQQLAPREAEVLLAVAELAWRGNDLPQALADLKRGQEVFPADARFYLSEAAVAAKRNDDQTAEKALRAGLEKVPASGQFGLLWELSNLLLDRGNLSEAKLAEVNQLLKKIGKAGASVAAQDYLQARLCLLDGRWTEAIQLLDRVQPQIKSPPDVVNQVQIFRAQCFEQLGDPVHQLEAYEQVVERDPLSGAELKAAAEARFGKTRLRFLQELRKDKADWKAFDEELARAAGTQPNSLQLLLLRVEVLAARNQYAEARQLLLDRLEQERKGKKPPVELYTALAALAERENQVAKSFDLLETAKKECGDSAELRLAYMQYIALAYPNDPKTAIGRLEPLAREWEKFSSEDQGRLLRGLAETYQRLGAVSEAAEYWRRLAQHPLYRADARVRLILLDHAMQADDRDAVNRLLDEIKAIDGGQGPMWGYGEAQRLLWLKKRGEPADLDTARTLLVGVKAQRPAWPAAWFALAEVEALQGKQQESQDDYRQAFHLSERNPLLLAEMLGAGGQSQSEVEQSLQRATIMAETVPEVWVAYIQYLAGRDRAKAETAIAQAQSRLPAEKKAVALGLCYEAVGRLKEAQQQLEEALNKQPNEAMIVRLVAGFYLRTGRLQDAGPLLSRIVEGKTNASASDLAWARNGLALVLVASGDYRRLSEAVSLVGLTIDADGNLVETKAAAADTSEDALRARARVLSTQTRKKARTRAIALLEDLSARQALGADDRFLLAQLYEEQNDWPKARELLSKLSEARVPATDHLAHYVEALLRAHEVEEAQRVFAQLEKIDQPQGGKDQHLLVILKAQLLESQNQGDQALALLRNFAERPGARPEDRLDVIVSLGRQMRYAEALQGCALAWQSCPAEIVGGMSVSLLRQSGANEAPSKDVEERLRAAIQVSKNSAKEDRHKTALLLGQLADLLDLRRRYPEAEKHYRMALEKEPDNLLALNNLAWLLAQRSENGAEALALIQRALDLAGPRPELLDTRAVALLSLKRHEQALADLRKAVAESPTALTYFHMARALDMGQDRAGATAALRDAKRMGLNEQHLHPLEQEACAKLLEELKQL
jgi:tetratricopeptide (TPR) repeat protein